MDAMTPQTSDGDWAEVEARKIANGPNVGDPDSFTAEMARALRSAAARAVAEGSVMLQHNYALCFEIARMEHELTEAVKGGHKLSTTRGPYATELLSLYIGTLLRVAEFFADCQAQRRIKPAWRDVPAFREKWGIPIEESVEQFAERITNEAIKAARVAVGGKDKP